MTIRRSLQRLSAPFMGAALAATALSLWAPAPAHADDYCEYEDATFPRLDGFAPSTVVIGDEGSALVKFRVLASDRCGIDDWDIYGPDVWVSKNDPSDAVSVYKNSEAGKSFVDVSVQDPAYNTTTKRYTLTLLRKTYWSGFNASPEPVRKGNKVTIKAKLKRADWDSYTFVGGDAQRVKVQFKAKGSSSWTTVKTVSTAKSGALSTTVKASGKTGNDGSYRLSFAGNGISSSATSAGDYVDVR